MAQFEETSTVGSSTSHGFRVGEGALEPVGEHVAAAVPHHACELVDRLGGDRYAAEHDAREHTTGCRPNTPRSSG